jgi:hypothetical protein
VGLSLCGLTFAQPAEDYSAVVDPGTGPAPIGQAVPNISGLLFVGTSQNTTDPAGTLNDVFTVDPVTDIPNSILTDVGTWGATADVANQRVLFTRSSGTASGNELFEIPYAGGDPASLGTITYGGGANLRVDGLAISGGVLYATNAGGLSTENGLWSVDWGTLEATNVALFSDSISGIDADPDTGIIYGVNDSAGALVTLSTTGTITNVIAYPGGLADIDGIACGDGKCYLVTDEAGDIPVYDIASGTFETPLTSPFTAASVFSAGAIATGGGGGDDGGDVPATTGIGIALLVLLLGGGSAYYLRRK